MSSLPTGRDVVNLSNGQLNTHDIYGNPTAAVLELLGSHQVGWSRVDTYVSPYVGGEVGLSVPWPPQTDLQPTIYGIPLFKGNNERDPDHKSFITSGRFVLTETGLVFAGPKDLLDLYALTTAGIVPPPFYLTPQARLDLALAETGERHFDPEAWARYSFLLRAYLAERELVETQARGAVSVFVNGETPDLNIDGIYNRALQLLRFYPTLFDGSLEQHESFPDLTVETFPSDFKPFDQQTFRVGDVAIQFQLLKSYASSGHKNVGFHHDVPPVLIRDEDSSRVSGHVGLNSEGTHYVVTFPGFKGHLTHPRIIENVEARREFRLKVESRSDGPNLGSRKTHGCVASLIPEHQREAFGLAMAHPDPRVPLALAPVMDQLGDLSPTQALRFREIIDTSRHARTLSPRLSAFFTDIVVRDLGRLARNEEGSTSAEYVLGPLDEVRQGRAVGGNLAMLGGAVYKAWEKSQASGESFFTTFGHTVAADFVRLRAYNIGEETLAMLFKVFSHTAPNLLARSGLGGLASFGINSFTGETDFSLTSLARHTLIDGFGFGGMNAGVEALALKVLGKSFGAGFAASLLGVGLATLATSEAGQVWDHFFSPDQKTPNPTFQPIPSPTQNQDGMNLIS